MNTQQKTLSGETTNRFSLKKCGNCNKTIPLMTDFKTGILGFNYLCEYCYNKYKDPNKSLFRRVNLNNGQKQLNNWEEK